MTHLIIAPILLPAILAAAILLLARGNLRVQRVVSGLGVVMLAMLAVVALAQATLGPQAYFLGHWPAPFGIALLLDRLSALLLALVAGLAAIVLLYVVGSGWDKRGARSRLDRRRTVKEAVKRRAIQTDPVPFSNDDLRFRQLVRRARPATNAVVLFALDVSGSMGETQRKLAPHVCAKRPIWSCLTSGCPTPTASLCSRNGRPRAH